MNKRFCISIQGRVQGVGFRYHTRSLAEKWGICGFVKNMPDGSVYIEAEGDETVLGGFVTYCREGPPHAHVNHVSIIESNLLKETAFMVK